MLKKGRRLWCCCFLVPIFLVMCFWVSSVTSNRPLLSPIAPALPPHNHVPQFSSNQNVEKQEGEEEEEEVSTSSRLGSRPPSCRYRCKGCVPCEAIQIPTKTSPVGLLYANYEPEGWRCKCGASFFNP